MELLAQKQGDILVIAVPGDRIDAAVSLEFKEAMRQATTEPSKRVILNMRNVKFIDSSGLGAIVGAMKQLDEGRSLELSDVRGAVEKVFRLTHMDSVFDIHHTLSDVIHV
ncbi:STAS domain-containing protein [Cognatishimia sp. SS12]|uniref:STAS domain-containing protein n=1 Tax=Cognatishimia sp. SS12 TaxID=2979465 RepID=UPI00232E0EA7|nr:STAS domain-containing protein [Cognatishimia sp. SS12]MDC0737938.1 STAS domain-containing protein [Cognatishimia sp. SS12]